MWIVSQFSIHGQGGFAVYKSHHRNVCPWIYTLVCGRMVGEALIQSRQSLTLNACKGKISKSDGVK